MPIDNTAMDVIISTVTAVVQEPTISTITAIVQDNIVQIPFDVISQVRDFYEVSWNKLMLFISTIGAIGLFVLGYIVPTLQKKKFKKLLLNQERIFNDQIDKQKKDFEEKFTNMEKDSNITKARILENSAILLNIIYGERSKEDKYFIKNSCILWCSAILCFLEIGDSIYKEKNMESMNKKLKNLNCILEEKNKEFIDKNLLKEVLDNLQNIDRKRINADCEDNIEKITKFYNTL